MTLPVDSQQDLRERDERLFAMLAAISRDEDPPGADWIAILLWTLVMLTLAGGAFLLWMLNR